MRTVLLIVGVIFGAIMTDLLIGVADPASWLAPRLSASIGEAGMVGSVFLIPALIVFTPTKTPSGRRWSVRIPLAVVLSWHSQLIFRMHFNLPALRQIAYEKNNDMYDGNGMNAAIIVMGWAPPLLVSVFMAAACATVVAIRGSRSNKDPSAISQSHNLNQSQHESQ